MSNSTKNNSTKSNKKPHLLQNEKWKGKKSVLFYVILFGTFVFVSLILTPPTERTKYSELKESDIANEEVIAPFTFTVSKAPDKLRQEQEKAAKNVLPVFHKQDSVFTNAIDTLNIIQNQLTPIVLTKSPDSIKYREIRTLFHKFGIFLEPENLQFFAKLANQQKKSRKSRVDSLRIYFDQLRHILTDLYQVGITNVKKADISGSNKNLFVITDQDTGKKSFANIFEFPNIEQQILNKLRSLFKENNESIKVGYAILLNLIKPDIFYDKKVTERKIRQATNEIPTLEKRILKGERIIDNHERITEEHINILNALSDELVKRKAQGSTLSVMLMWIGKLFMIVLSQIPLILFLYIYRKNIWNDRRMMFIIYSAMLFVVVISAIVLFSEYSKYLIPIAAAPIIINSYKDTKTAFFVGLALSLLVGIQHGNDFNLVLVGILTSAAAILAIGFSKYRKRLTTASIYVFLAYSVSITSLEIIRNTNFHDLSIAWLSAIGASIFVTIIAYGFIMLFDSIFDVASEFKLIELSDLNNPILKMLSMWAPGSYHHSIQVSNISEIAAEAIGANALLTKVGAYYHDIGKMFKPNYFVENQKGGKNPHDKLTPRLSSLILINHVRRGNEFAREKKLPSVVRKFIIEHHGNSLMKYFYEKAKEQANDKQVLEDDFRYPGIKPQSKETGILMLADSVEAMVRSIKEPNLSKIRNAIRSVIEEKIRSGELDECPLTMKDLGIIVKNFSKALSGMYHDRLEYPGQKELFERPIKEIFHA